MSPTSLVNFINCVCDLVRHIFSFVSVTNFFIGNQLSEPNRNNNICSPTYYLAMETVYKYTKIRK